MQWEIFGQVLLNAIVMSSVYILLAVGFNLVWGILKIFNFAHGYFFMLGSFFAFYLMDSLGFNFYIALFATGVFILILSAIAYSGVLGSLRENEFACVISSFGLCNLIEGVSAAVFGGEPQKVNLPITGGLKFAGIYLNYPRLATLLISLIIILVFLYVVYATKFGRAMRATGSNSKMAEAQGINVSMVLLSTFCVGTVLAGLGGVVASHMTPLTPNMGIDYSTKAFVIVVLGGLGSIPGAILGALIIGFVEGFIGFLFDPTIALIISFVVVLIILLFRPIGLLGRVSGL
jgi:branched-chain amino acid transport system permease protein